MLEIIQNIIIIVCKITNEVLPFIEIEKHYNYLHNKQKNSLKNYIHNYFAIHFREKIFVEKV